MQTKNRIILALDVNGEKEAQKLVFDLKEWVGFFKIGMKLFFRYGPEIVNLVKGMGGKVFLDAKLHDIPTVVEATVRTIGRMDVSMLTIHTLGGMEMMRRSVQAVKEENPQTRILGVTLLTSLDEKSLRGELGIKVNPQEEVLFLAQRAKEAGLDGVVCSGKEVKLLRKSLGPSFLLVVPGIRMGKVKGDEQKRVLTPEEAICRGADYLVIGRPILQASDPVKAVREIAKRIVRFL